MNCADLQMEIFAVEDPENIGKLEDFHHSFNELYYYRLLYNSMLFNEWSKQNKYNVHKSKRHHTGEECFGGTSFIVVAELPTGQISNHYKLEYWDLFKCKKVELPVKYDGHNAEIAANRLLKFIRGEYEGS